jgi:hypothetical protein
MSEAVMAMVIGSGPGVAPDDSAGMELKPAISSLLRAGSGMLHTACSLHTTITIRKSDGR